NPRRPAATGRTGSARWRPRRGRPGTPAVIAAPAGRPRRRRPRRRSYAGTPRRRPRLPTTRARRRSRVSLVSKIHQNLMRLGLLFRKEIARPVFLERETHYV